jgi:hypothetical protein
MALINFEHFFNEFNVAQKAQPAVQDKLQDYIDTYELEYLEGVLGDEFSALVSASPDARFQVIKARLTAKPSPITAYVFFNYQRDMIINATGSGDSKSKPENATRSPESFRMRIAWNIMVDKNKKLWKWLCDNQATYPEFDIMKVDGSFGLKVNDFGI